MNNNIKNQFNQSTLNDPVFNFSKQEIPKILSTSLPFLPEVFLGRDADLEAVHEKLFSGENLLLLVNGEGGIGKTAFAAKYWQRYESQYHYLAWVYTGNNLLNALLTLATNLPVSFSETDTAEQRLSKMLPVMAGLDKPCLLVLDNANDADELDRNYKALRACTNFHILLTTRITTFEQAGTHPIPPLDEEHALTLFKKHYAGHQDNDDELLKAIRKAVGGNTLVLELLAKNLAAINTDEVFYSLADLLRDLQQKGLLQLSQQANIKIPGKRSGHSLEETRPTDILAALYDEVEMVKPLNDKEKQLLSNLAVLPAENIPYDLLKTLLVPDDVRAFSKTLTDLANRGWLEKSRPATGETQYKVSPVIQEITRHKNQPQLFEHVNHLIKTLNEKLDYEPGGGHLVNARYEEAAVYAKYAETLVNHVEETEENLAILCDRIGNYQKTTGNLNQALSYYKECSHLEKELHDATPQNVDFKNGLAISYQHLGRTYTALGDLDQALRFYEQYNQLEKELHDAYPQNMDFKNGLAISYQSLGMTYTALGDLDQALRLYEQFNQLEKELHDVYPQNMDFKNGLAISYQHLGTTYTEMGDLDQALSYYKECSQLEKELHDAYPQNMDFKNGLAISYQNIGRTYTAQGDLSQALSFYKEYSRLEKELHAAYPQNVTFKNALAISYSKLGDTHTALGNLDQALRFFEERSRLGKELHDAYPQYVDFKNGLAISYQYLGMTYTALDDLDQALRFFEQYNQLENELYAAYPQNVEFKNNLAISYERLGETHTALGDLEQALIFFEKGLELSKELYDTYPQNVFFKNWLAISYSQLGRFYRDKKVDKAKAQQNFEKCYRLWQELAAAYPAYVEFGNNLAWAKNALDGLV